MVLDDASDENRRSCGSFFVNPVVSAADAARVEARAGDPAMPRWPERDGRVKLSAAWLIERAGFRRGERDGAVGLSTRHSLAVVAHAGASARDVVRLARRSARPSRRASASAWSPSPSSGASTAWRVASRPTARPAHIRENSSTWLQRDSRALA